MGNLVNFIEFAKVGELRHEEEYCLSRGILRWLPSTFLAFNLQTMQINCSRFACHVNTQTAIKGQCYLTYQPNTLKNGI